MKNSAKTRRMKVYSKILKRREKLAWNYMVTFPEIRLMGKWLQECGFEPGQEINIATASRKLVITIEPQREENEATIPEKASKKRKKSAVK